MLFMLSAPGFYRSRSAFCYGSSFPSGVTVMTRQGIALPQFSSAVFTAKLKPPQQGLIIISPILSVLYIFVPLFSNLPIISLLGCPNLLFSPTPIKAILGETASKNFSELEVLDPMMRYFQYISLKFIFRIHI